MDLVITDKCE